MPVYHKHKSIFIHIPKSAGSTIHKILDNSESYSNHQQLKLNSITRDYFKFTFARNPFDRFVSTYFYFKGYGRDGVGDVKMGNVVNRYNSFKNFVLNFNKIPSTEWCYPHWNEQIHWIHKDLDFIGKFENLQADFNIVCDKIRIPKEQLPHVNKSNHKHYSEYYDNKTREIIAQRYARDIEYFGYEFEQ